MDHLFCAFIGDQRLNEVCKPYKNSGKPNKAVKNGNELRHGSHSDAHGDKNPDYPANRHHPNDNADVVKRLGCDGATNREDHPEHAEHVSAHRRLLVAQASETQDKEDRGDNVE